MNAIQEIMRFQTDRELPYQEFVDLNEFANIVEELMESLGYDTPKGNRSALQEHIRTFANKLITLNAVEAIPNKTEDKVDAYGDIIVFAIGAIMKLGYNPETVLDEVAKEINSREGEMINGKFEKYLDHKHRAKWYKADFIKCKL